MPTLCRRRGATRLLLAAILGSFWVFNISGPALADDDSTGPDGIRSNRLTVLGLTGSGVAIGQVEGNRVALPGFDTLAANPNVYANPTVRPTVVFNGAAAPTAGSGAELSTFRPSPDHAEEVAGVMIATGNGAPRSVAPDARLYSARTNPNSQPGFALASQNLITQAAKAGTPLRATNYSYGFPTDNENGRLNNTDLLTQLVDWSTRIANDLYVIAGGENLRNPVDALDANPVPNDAFNGIVVAATRQNGGVFNQVADFNTPLRADPAVAGATRVLTDIVAPGDDIRMPILCEQGRPCPQNGTDRGTSFAAPHVTATIADLDQYAANQIGYSDALHPEVMKAILMNSADKIRDDGTYVYPNGTRAAPGDFLGMDKTILSMATPNLATPGEAPSQDLDPAAPDLDRPADGQGEPRRQQSGRAPRRPARDRPAQRLPRLHPARRRRASSGHGADHRLGLWQDDGFGRQRDLHIGPAASQGELDLGGAGLGRRGHQVYGRRQQRRDALCGRRHFLDLDPHRP